jgi:hypothetical protein
MGYAHNDYISETYHSVDSGIESLVAGISALGRITSAGFHFVGNLQRFRQLARGVRANVESFLHPPFDVSRDLFRQALTDRISEHEISKLDDEAESVANFILKGDRIFSEIGLPLIAAKLYFRYRLRPELVKLVDTLEDLAGIMELAIGDDGERLSRDDMVSLLSADS